MGTSISSSGSPSDTPMVPPWVRTPVPPADNDSDDVDVTPSTHLVSRAPSGRFRGARLSLGRFADTGMKDDMKKGVARYVFGGMGGSDMMVCRLSSTIDISGAIFDALSGVLKDKLDHDVLSDRNADKIMDVIVEEMCPVDGTLDAESSRDSIKRAFFELIKDSKNIDLLNLSKEQRIFVIKRYIARDVFNRFYLDTGKTIQEKAPTVKKGLLRLNEVKEYIMETIVGEFEKLENDAAMLNGKRVKGITRDALKEAMNVLSKEFYK